MKSWNQQSKYAYFSFIWLIILTCWYRWRRESLVAPRSDLSAIKASNEDGRRTMVGISSGNSVLYTCRILDANWCSNRCFYTCILKIKAYFLWSGKYDWFWDFSISLVNVIHKVWTLRQNLIFLAFITHFNMLLQFVLKNCMGRIYRTNHSSTWRTCIASRR